MNPDPESEGGGESPVLASQSPPLSVTLGGNSIEKCWLEKSLEFWLEIPYTKEMFKNL